MADQILIDIIDEHLPYEIDMLRNAYSALAATPPPTGVCKNALIESFCVHARSLIHFFANKRTKLDDAIASDFTDNSIPWLDLGVDPLKSILQKLNKQAFHLTCARTIIGKFDPGTDGTVILKILEHELHEFRKSLTPDFKHFKCMTSALPAPVSAPLGSSSYSTSITLSFPAPKTGPTGP